MYNEQAFIGTEAGLRAKFNDIPLPSFFHIPTNPNMIVGDTKHYERWGPVNYFEWDGEYDGAF